jgi:hypothetical protein
MFTASRPVFLRSLVRGRKRRRDIELADMGTAFALDHAFDDAPAPGDAPKSAPARWRFWFGRKSGA